MGIQTAAFLTLYERFYSASQVLSMLLRKAFKVFVFIVYGSVIYGSYIKILFCLYSVALPNLYFAERSVDGWTLMCFFTDENYRA